MAWVAYIYHFVRAYFILTTNLTQPTKTPNNPKQTKKVRRAQQQPRQPEDDRRASGRRRSMALYAAVTAPAPLAVRGVGT